jgi:hypothetical protein
MRRGVGCRLGAWGNGAVLAGPARAHSSRRYRAPWFDVGVVVQVVEVRMAARSGEGIATDALCMVDS